MISRIRRCPTRRLRPLLSLVLLLALSPLLAGCVSNIGPGGAPPGLLFSDVTYPNVLNPGMEYRIAFDRDDVELLGLVEAEASSRWYFFLFSSGDSGYAKLMEQVREKGGDGVMNVTIDTAYKSYFLFYARATSKLTGMAYRYKRDEPAPSAMGRTAE